MNCYLCNDELEEIMIFYYYYNDTNIYICVDCHQKIYEKSYNIINNVNRCLICGTEVNHYGIRYKYEKINRDTDIINTIKLCDKCSNKFIEELKIDIILGDKII